MKTERATADSTDLVEVLARAAVIAAVLAGGAFIWTAASFYPGGTAWDASAPGHDFWLNFLCDLQRVTARNGESNSVGSHLTQTAMATIAAAFVAQFWLTTRLAHLDPVRTRQVRLLGATSAVGTFLVAFMPTDVFGWLHDLGIAAGTIPGLVAIGLLVPRLARVPDAKLSAVVGAAFLGVAAVDFGLYLHQLTMVGPPTPVIPILERLSFLLLLLWMMVVALTDVEPAA